MMAGRAWIGVGERGRERGSKAGIATTSSRTRIAALASSSHTRTDATMLSVYQTHPPTRFVMMCEAKSLYVWRHDAEVLSETLL